MGDVNMPRLSDSMEEGTILRWLKHAGDEVKRGEEIAEIETDKATMAYEADADGVLEIVAEEGATLAVGELIGRIGAAGGDDAADQAPTADSSAAANGAGGDGAAAESPSEPRPPTGPSDEDLDGPSSEQNGDSAQASGGSASPGESAAPSQVPAAPPATPSAESDGEAVASEPSAPSAEHEPPSDNGASAGAPDPERVKASPVARRIARDKGVDLHAVQGTGPGGRVVKADVERSEAPAQQPEPEAAESPEAAAAPPADATAAERQPDEVPSAPEPSSSGEHATAKGAVELQDLSRIQQLVARRMAESKALVPEYTVTVEIEMDRCVELRGQLRQLELDPTPSYNDMIVRACALALRQHPRANGSYNRDGRFELYSRVNVGIAVAAEDSLVVPTIFDADHKSLAEIARDAHALAARVRSGEITPPELSGGTFTVSNLGMYGISHFTAVINPPQAAILAVGTMQPKAVVRDGQVVARQMMSATLTSDHRILYGADAAEFLGRVRTLLEAPAALML